MKKFVSVLLIAMFSITISPINFAMADPDTKASVQFKKVNINTATLKELVQLPGIGRSKAKAIIEYREEHGAILGTEELVLVPGIGKKALKRLQDKIVFE